MEVFKQIWQALPWFGVSASLSGSATEADPEGHIWHDKDVLFLDLVDTLAKEMLCSNASDRPGWKKPPPMYISYFDVTISYDTAGVALPSIFPPLSVFHPHVDIVLGPGQEPQVYEDAYLFVTARLPQDFDILKHMHLEEWR